MPDNVKRFLDWKHGVLPKGLYSKWTEVSSEIRDPMNKKHNMVPGASKAFSSFVHVEQHQTREGFTAAVEVVRKLHAMFDELGLGVPEWTKPPEWLDG